VSSAKKADDRLQNEFQLSCVFFKHGADIVSITDPKTSMTCFYAVIFSSAVSFLADRTNGRAIATLLRLSSSSVTLCIVL